MTITLTKQEISDLTISCEAMMEQLNDDIQDYGEGFARPQQERIWDLRNKLNK